MKDSCFNEFDPSALSVEDALNEILSSITPKKSYEIVKIKDAYNRILARDIKARKDIPNYKNSAMDGYAVNINHTSKEYVFKNIGESFAGHPFKGKVKPNEAIKVMTGALVPEGCNAVIMQEMVEEKNNLIFIKSRVAKNQNIRFPGEDIKKSDLVLRKGKEINEIDIGILASLGQSSVHVQTRPTIGYFSTGDELVSVGKSIKKSQVYDSNRYLLHGLLQKYPAKIKDYGVVKDNMSSIIRKLKIASNECDLLLTTGGVSVGDADFVKGALDKLGKINFWKIAVKPGRPLAYGKINKCLFFGLPGNPVSVVVTFNLFVSAAIKKITGQSIKNLLSLSAKLESDIKKRKGRKEYKRGLLKTKNGKLFVKCLASQGSNILSSLLNANCYIELDENIDKIHKGSLVKIIPFELEGEYYD